MSDQAVAERVLGHIDEGSTDRGDAIWREPVANYRSRERLDEELRVLRRSPLAFCPSAALREPGSYVARESAGTPLYAVRGRAGRVRRRLHPRLLLLLHQPARRFGVHLRPAAACSRAHIASLSGNRIGRVTFS